MMDASKFLVTSFILVSAILLSGNEACLCTQQHPQQQFCAASYAIKVLVLSSKTVTLCKDRDRNDPTACSVPTHQKYNVRVLKTYKGGFGEHELNDIWSPLHSCVVELQVGHYYVLTGVWDHVGFLQLNSCNLYYDITHLHYLTSRLISENFLRNWQRGCDRCDFCKEESCEDSKSCRWSPTSSNETLGPMLSYCAPNQHEVCKFSEYDLSTLKDGKKEKYQRRRSSLI